jgi:hypothetical protein
VLSDTDYSFEKAKSSSLPGKAERKRARARKRTRAREFIKEQPVPEGALGESRPHGDRKAVIAPGESRPHGDRKAVIAPRSVCCD